MPTKMNPTQKSEQIQALYGEAKKSKQNISRFETTAARKAATLERLITASSAKLNDGIAAVKDRLASEGKDFQARARAERALVEGIRKDAKSDYDRFSKTYRAAMNKTNGVEAKHNRVSEMADIASDKLRSITKDERQATKATADIGGLLKDSKTKA